MDKPLFVSGIENLTLRTSPGRGDAVLGDFSITTDDSFVRGLIPAAARPVIGGIELKSLTDGRPVAYSRLDLKLDTDADAYKRLERWLKLVAAFLHRIWYLKDHAANQEFGYVIFPLRGEVKVARNFLGIVVTDASCETTTVRLSEAEFRALRAHFATFFTSHLTGSPRFTRLERADYFLQGARAIDQAPVKIANYCTALEALFSNDSSELTHKLCERVAWFLGRDREKRLETFGRIKRAYGIRSRVVHGAAKWSHNTDEAREAAVFLDRVLRQALNTIAENPQLHELFTEEGESGRRNHESYFHSLVLGAGPQD